MTLHTVINGVALAASVEVGSRGDHLAALAGLGTFLVIFLHKPFDAMTISTLMTVGAWSRPATHLVNGLFALMIPVGVALFYLGLGSAHENGDVVAYALAFSAGTFLCISMSDLLPELQFHAHDRAALSLALMLGLSVAWVIAFVESRSHGHAQHDQPPGVEAHDQQPEHPHDPAHEHCPDESAHSSSGGTGGRGPFPKGGAGGGWGTSPGVIWPASSSEVSTICRPAVTSR